MMEPSTKQEIRRAAKRQQDEFEAQKIRAGTLRPNLLQFLRASYSNVINLFLESELILCLQASYFGLPAGEILAGGILHSNARFPTDQDAL